MRRRELATISGQQEKAGVVVSQLGKQFNGHDTCPATLPGQKIMRSRDADKLIGKPGMEFNLSGTSKARPAFFPASKPTAGPASLNPSTHALESDL